MLEDQRRVKEQYELTQLNEQRRALRQELLDWAIAVTRRSLADLATEPATVVGYAAVVRRCEMCTKYAGFLDTSGLDAIPDNLHQAFGRFHNFKQVRALCSHCGHPAHNEHAMFANPSLLVWLSPDDMRLLTRMPTPRDYPEPPQAPQTTV